MDIAVFDADAIIKMGRPTATGNSLLSELVQYFTVNYVHQQVYNEVKGKEKAHLDQLIQQGILTVQSDADILDLMAKRYSSETAACKLYMMALDSSIQNFDPSGLLQPLYAKIFNRYYSTKNDLTRDLSAAEQALTKRTSIGEIKTWVLVQALRDDEQQRINFFVSDDSGARELFVRQGGGTVQTCSVMGSYRLLRDRHLSKADALQYWGQYGPGIRVTVRDHRNKEKTMPSREVLDDIYDLSKTTVLTKHGYIRYVT